jgi:iron(III) transport system ATP-binding protein
MNEGNIMQIGTPFEIYSRPANRFVADFIGRVNFFTGKIVSPDMEGSGGVDIEFPGGRRKTLADREGSFKKGAEITLTVRPESLRLKGGSSAEQSVFGGTVIKSVYLGQLVEYEIDCGGEKPVLAVTYDPADQGFFKTGEQVGIDFSAPAAHILPE